MSLMRLALASLLLLSAGVASAQRQDDAIILIAHPAFRDLEYSRTVLIAAPAEQEGERLRSGTWATVRYARRLGRRVVLVCPDGSLREDGAG